MRCSWITKARNDENPNCVIREIRQIPGQPFREEEIGVHCIPVSTGGRLGNNMPNFPITTT